MSDVTICLKCYKLGGSDSIVCRPLTTQMNNTFPHRGCMPRMPSCARPWGTRHEQDVPACTVAPHTRKHSPPLCRSPTGYVTPSWPCASTSQTAHKGEEGRGDLKEGAGSGGDMVLFTDRVGERRREAGEEVVPGGWVKLRLEGEGEMNMWRA